mmetsp:Transcript_87366/g.157375  ORF Transcript_87366/g.157375 Transcript_87366/m.157375 type:complete len:209 (-) Transcript_87366:695-1321(-)
MHHARWHATMHHRRHAHHPHGIVHHHRVHHVRSGHAHHVTHSHRRLMPMLMRHCWHRSGGRLWKVNTTLREASSGLLGLVLLQPFFKIPEGLAWLFQLLRMSLDAVASFVASAFKERETHPCLVVFHRSHRMRIDLRAVAGILSSLPSCSIGLNVTFLLPLAFLIFLVFLLFFILLVFLLLLLFRLLLFDFLLLYLRDIRSALTMRSG